MSQGRGLPRGLLSNPSVPRVIPEDDDSSSGDEMSGSRPSPRDAPRPTRDEDAGAAGGARGGVRPVVQGGAAKLPVQIRTMTGKTYKIEAKSNWDVKRLREEFEKWHEGNAAQCQLYFKAKKLQDNNTLLSYKIGPGDFIMANWRSTGGVFYL